MNDGRRFGCPPKPYSLPEAPEGKLNTTDPDAPRMKFGRNFIPLGIAALGGAPSARATAGPALGSVTVGGVDRVPPRD